MIAQRAMFSKISKRHFLFQIPSAFGKESIPTPNLTR
jgi:hypothetical protein